MKVDHIKALIKELDSEAKNKLIKGLVKENKDCCMSWKTFRDKEIHPILEKRFTDRYEFHRVYGAIQVLAKAKYGKDYTKLKGDKFQVMKNDIINLIDYWFD